MMKKRDLLGASLCLVAIVFWGCGGGGGENQPLPQGHNPQAIVTNGTSNNITSVDLLTGSVTSALGGISIGPNANRVKIRGSKAYIVNSGNFSGSTEASVEVVDLNANAITKTIPFDPIANPETKNPMDIAFVSDTKAYVTCLYGNTVAVVDPTHSGSAAILKTIDLPVFGEVKAGPQGIVISGHYAYTANTGFDLETFSYIAGSVSVIDTDKDEIVDADGDPSNGNNTPILTSQVDPQDLDVDSAGKIRVICTGHYASDEGTMDVIDPSSLTVTTSIHLGGSPLNISIGGNLALIGAGDSTNTNLYVVRTDTDAVLRDSSDPWILLTDTGGSGFWNVGKIGVSNTGLVGYVPAGYTTSAEAKLVEISLVPSLLEITRVFDLASSAVLPSAVGIWE